ncbi:ATP-binding protein [Azospirillum halopraeferens]|uniref:ATP-binding protein n=1 Tax=Azospirillum halopraeferens TaxID=34010 RepID=UPI0003FF1FD9|nr:ATP-binding protein [Azospirillum halopraeferens]
MAFFDHVPDWRRDGRGLSGSLAWTGTHFGIRGLEERGLEAVADAVCAEDRESFLRIFVPTEEASRAGEFRLGLADGRVVFLYCDASIEMAADGRPARIFGTLHDVTDRRRFEAQLSDILREREMLLAVIDACPISITVADAQQPDTPLIYANRTFETLTGYTRDEVLGSNCRFLQGPDSDPAALRVLHDAVVTGSQAEVRLTNRRKDGTPFLNRLVLAPIRNDRGHVTAFIGLQSDVTDEARREEADKQRQRIEALGRMMGGIAHEINNLLQPITLMTEELIARHTDDAERPYLDAVLDCALNARRIIGDLLAFSRPSGRKAEVMDAATLLHDALVLIRKAVGPGIVMDLDVHSGDDRIAVRADKTAFTQVLLNLAGNAAAAMGGTGAIRIALTPGRMVAAGSTGRCARIDVTDSGCGMDRATLERAFEPFFTTKPIGQGTGLGLSVAFGLVKDMGGEITLDSAPGRGTTATVLLPEVIGDWYHGHHTRH